MVLHAMAYFKQLNTAWTQIEAFVIDKDLTERAVLKNMFPDATECDCMCCARDSKLIISVVRYFCTNSTLYARSEKSSCTVKIWFISGSSRCSERKLADVMYTRTQPRYEASRDFSDHL